MRASIPHRFKTQDCIDTTANLVRLMPVRNRERMPSGTFTVSDDVVSGHKRDIPQAALKKR